jgi:enamine deaminase RidA (YjgF/YER057c/UK114 family)
VARRVSEAGEAVPGRPRRPGRRLISSGGPWEHVAGYSRAVVVGDSCWVAGTTDAGPDGHSEHPTDMDGQARSCFRIVDAALTRAGFSFGDVVRTRMYVTDMSRAAEAIAVHGEIFGQIRPAATLIEVARLIDDSLLIEVEVEARKA